MTEPALDPLDLPAARPQPDYLTRIRAAAARFAQVLAEGDLDARVPACPGWTLHELADHLGGIHQWAAHAVTAGNPDCEPTPAPPDRAGLVDWYAASVGGLVDVLRDTPPDAPAWGFGPKPWLAAFWHRRQAHELAMHLWDAAASQGGPMPDDLLDDEFAADGVDEVATVFFPRQVRLGRLAPLESSLALVAGPATRGGNGFTTPAAPRWVLGGTGSGPESAPGAPVAATVTGPARDLLLVLWHRLPLERAQLTVGGDPEVAADLLARGLTP